MVCLFVCLCFAGKQYYEGQPVYPEQRSSQSWNGVFPDGVPLGKDGDKKPPYVFVWKTWGTGLSWVLFSVVSFKIIQERLSSCSHTLTFYMLSWGSGSHFWANILFLLLKQSVLYNVHYMHVLDLVVAFTIKTGVNLISYRHMILLYV